MSSRSVEAPRPSPVGGLYSMRRAKLGICAAPAPRGAFLVPAPRPAARLARRRRIESASSTPETRLPVARENGRPRGGNSWAAAFVSVLHREISTA